MKLQKIEIYGYGKYVDQTFQLGPHMNIFRGDNGSGKSTLMSFILSIMFGFPNLRKKHAREYDVNENVVFGGRLHLSDTRYGNVIIKRVRQLNKQQLSLIIEDGEEVTVDNFDELLDGLNKKDYLSFFGFNENDLMDFIWEDEDEFAKSLLSLGVSGRQILTEINPILTREADDIFLPNGKKPYLNQRLQVLEDNRRQLNHAQKNEQQYFDLMAKLAANKKKLNELLEQQKNEKNTEIQLELAKQQSGSMIEQQALAEEIANYQFYDFEDDLELKWKQSTNQLDQLETEYEQLSANGSDETINQSSSVTDEEKTAAITGSDDIRNKPISSGMQWIENHRGLATQMLSEARAYRDKVRQHDDLNQQVIEKRFEQKRLLSALGVNAIDELPEDLTAEERLAWQRRLSANEGQRVFSENIQQDIAKLNNQREELKHERNELVSELENLQAQAPASGQLNSMPRNFGIILVLISIGLLIAYLLIDSAFFLGSGIAALIIGLIFILVGMRYMRQPKGDRTHDIEIYQLDIQDIDKELLELEHKTESQIEQLTVLSDDTESITKELAALVSSRGGSESVDGLVWITNDYIDEINTLESEINSLLSIIGLDNYKRAHEGHWLEYEGQIAEAPLALDTVFQHFEDDYHDVRQLEADSGYAQHERRENSRRLKQIQQKIERLKQERAELLADYQFSDGQALISAIHDEDKMKFKRERFNILSAHLDPELSRYQDQELSIDDQIQANKDNLATLNQAIHNLVEENANISNQMLNIEESGLVSQLQQDDANNYAAVYEAAVEWAARKLAVAIFEASTVGQESDVIDRVLNHANQYLSDLSDGKLQQLRYENNTIEVYNQGLVTAENDHGWLPVWQLSRGEKALLFIAMRFAFLNAQLGQMNMPIIIDEGFVHLDPKYRKNIYHFLAERAKTNQIILFTIDYSATEILSGSNIYHL